MDRMQQFFAGPYGEESSIPGDLVARAEQGQVFVLASALGPVILRKYGALAVTDFD